MAAILNGVLILDYMADKLHLPDYAAPSHLIDQAITMAFARNSMRLMKFGGDMSTKSVINTIAKTFQSLSPEL